VAVLTTAIFLIFASGTTMANEKLNKLIEQCTRQITDTSAPSGMAMSFHMLQKLGPKAKTAIPALTKALDHEKSFVRIQSAYTLWKIDQQEKVIPLLSDALQDKEIKPRDRAIAAWALGEIGPSAKDALPLIRKATLSQEAKIQVNSAWALWTVGQESDLAKKVLIELLKNDDLNVFSSAAWALGEIGFEEAGLKALTEAIQDDSNNYKESASKRAFSGLAKALNSNDPGVRRQAISVISLVSKKISTFGNRDKGAQAVIIALVKTKKNDNHLEIREAATDVLNKINPKVVLNVEAKTVVKSNPTVSSQRAKEVATAFFVALADKNIDEAVKYVSLEERDDFKQQLNKSIPALPKEPKLQIKLKENGTRASALLLNTKIGMNMKLIDGKWWIVK